MTPPHRTAALVACTLLGVARAEGQSAPAEAPEPPIERAPDEVIVHRGRTSPAGRLAPGPIVDRGDRSRGDHATPAPPPRAGALAGRPGLWLERGRAVRVGAIDARALGAEYVVVLDRRSAPSSAASMARSTSSSYSDLASSIAIDVDARAGRGDVRLRRHRRRDQPDLATVDEERASVAARADHRGGSELRGAIAGGTARWAGGLSARWARADAIDRDPSDVSTTISGYTDASVDARARSHRAGWRLDGSSRYQWRDLRAIDATATGAVLDRRNLIEVAGAQVAALRATERTRALLTVGLGYHRDQFASDQRGAAALDSYQDTRERLIEASGQVEHRVAERHLTSGAIEVAAERLTSPRLREDGGRERAAVWLQHEWRPGADYRWLVAPAARLDVDSQFGTHATPRLAVRWDPTDEIVGRASLGLGYRAPSFKELLLRFENPGAGYVVDGNPDLTPETSRSLQLGVEWRPNDAVWLAANGFANDLTDLITAVTTAEGGPGMPLIFSYDNIGRARTAGGDLDVGLARGRLGVELGYGYTWTRDLETAQPLEGQPRHRVQAALRWRDPAQGLTAAVEVSVTGPRRYGAGPDQLTAPTRGELRARVARRFASGLGLAMGGDNLLDAGDADLDRQAPRTLYATIEVER
jgi:outer membrane receptor for ferrienterochelin and colicins